MARQRPTRIPTPHGIRYVQYQFEVSRCRNEEFIVQGKFGWAWSMWAGAPQDVQYQFEVSPCRNKEVIRGRFRVGNGTIHIKGNFGWVWSMWAGRPRIDCIVIRHVQYKFEVNRRRNKEVNLPYSGQDGRTDRRRR
ncbi:hypothetical protein DPMN_162451 [Dreissena polymorpha]|uniref:Uncharacterized protein n=1 Tax=Dreissena polymorpha TaxID=45954 RepID=A0A9D4EQK9_DREPO|nr:hypothetical protein DPMN_162451 [Dreissena polymorpha]